MNKSSLACLGIFYELKLRIIRKLKSIMEGISYAVPFLVLACPSGHINENTVKAGFVENPSSWLMRSARDYEGKPGPVKIYFLD